MHRGRNILDGSAEKVSHVLDGVPRPRGGFTSSTVAIALVLREAHVVVVRAEALRVVAIAMAIGACEDKIDRPPPRTRAPDWQSAFAHRVEYDTQRRAVVVQFDIAEGFHAYTRGETVGRPLALVLETGSAAELADEIVYPKGETRDLPLGRSVIVEGRGEIVAPVRWTRGATDTTARGEVKYQICTDDACDRPRAARFSVSTHIEPTAAP